MERSQVGVKPGLAPCPRLSVKPLADDDACQQVMGTLAAVRGAELHICNWESALLPLSSQLPVIFGGNLSGKHCQNCTKKTS